MTGNIKMAALHDLSADLREALINHGYSATQADAIVHALVDIAESTESIYGTLLPALVSSRNESAGAFKDKLWDVREEFRHVKYHIEDGKLTEL